MGSEIAVDKNRGFDTINVKSTYFKADSNKQGISDTSYSVSASGSFNSWGHSAGVSAAVSRRVVESTEEKGSKGILVITAFATSKNTR